MPRTARTPRCRRLYPHSLCCLCNLCNPRNHRNPCKHRICNRRNPHKPRDPCNRKNPCKPKNPCNRRILGNRRNPCNHRISHNLPAHPSRRNKPLASPLNNCRRERDAALRMCASIRDSRNLTVLMAGEPGIGKSTLLLETAANIARQSGNSAATNSTANTADSSTASTNSTVDATSPNSTAASTTPDNPTAPVLYISGEESQSQVRSAHARPTHRRHLP